MTPPDEWVEQHFDHLSPELARDFHPTLARARSRCPVAHSDAHGGFWVVTRYDDVLRIAQDWRTFSSELGITVPAPPVSMKILPVTIDPPLQRTFKRLLNAHFTPAKIGPWTGPTRQLVNQLIDAFIAGGECDFMPAFARHSRVSRSSNWRWTRPPMISRRSTTTRRWRPCRTASRDAEIDGHQVKAGERVIVYWASANRDEAEFTAPDAFDLDRATNRHVAFGAGPHRCVGSSLARMNLRIALEEVVRRMSDFRLQPGADVGFHSTFNRAPLSVPITFTAP